MAFVKNQMFSRKDKGMCLEGEYTISVDSQGIFSTVLPIDVVKELELVGIQLGENRRSKKKGWFFGSSLTELQSKIGTVMDQYFSKTLVSEEKVIRYQIATNCSYMIDPVHGLIPNGELRSTPGYQWFHGNDKRDHAPMGFNIYVNVSVKKTYKFLNGSEHYDYTTIPSNIKDHRSTTDLDWLSCLYHPKSIQGLPLQEIPANSENCRFFVNMVKGMYMLNEQVKHFFDPDNLQKIAKTGKLPTLTYASEGPQ